MHTLFVLLGPTGVGKTNLAILLANFFRCPIINADSRQIYRDIPIGTAAPTIDEQARATHYFVGQLSLQQYYSAAQYAEEATACIHNLFKTHPTLILSGGSMLYIDAVCNGIDDIPTVEDDIRSTLNHRYATEGIASLLDELKQRDCVTYEKIDRNNYRRVIHALEICLQTGKPYSSFLRKSTHNRPYRVIKIGLQRPREELYERINQRVDRMMKDGLLEEAERFSPLRQCNALNTVGYKELFAYFDGEWTLETAVEKIKRNTRVYARKQLTWFNHDNATVWFNPIHETSVLRFAEDCVESHFAKEEA